MGLVLALAACAPLPVYTTLPVEVRPSPNVGERRPNYVILHHTSSDTAERAIATLTSAEALTKFSAVFADVAKERISDEMLSSVLNSDGPMPTMTLSAAAKLLRHPWGQGFEAPAFDDSAIIDTVKPLGQGGLHWKIDARVGGRSEKTTVVLFNQPEPVLGQEVHLFLQPGLNPWRGNISLQWLGRVLQ
jgi:hypothetical protein